MGCHAIQWNTTGSILLFFFLPIMTTMYLLFVIGRAPSPISPDNQFYRKRPCTIFLVMFPTHAVHTANVILVDSGLTWLEDAQFVSVWREGLLVLFVEGSGISACNFFGGFFCQLVDIEVIINGIIIINIVIIVTLINDTTRRFPSILRIMANAHSITIMIQWPRMHLPWGGAFWWGGGAILFWAACGLLLWRWVEEEEDVTLLLSLLAE